MATISVNMHIHFSISIDVFNKIIDVPSYLQYPAWKTQIKIFCKTRFNMVYNLSKDRM